MKNFVINELSLDHMCKGVFTNVTKLYKSIDTMISKNDYNYKIVDFGKTLNYINLYNLTKERDRIELELYGDGDEVVRTLYIEVIHKKNDLDI